MKILITGATGFIGKSLVHKLIENGHTDLRILSRNKVKAKSSLSLPVEIFEWDPDSGHLEKGALDGVHHIIHLAGENIAAGRWTEKQKEKILASRTKGTKLLVNEILNTPNRIEKFISSSAIGIYGTHPEIEFTEEAKLGDDFLATVCKKWEDSLKPLEKTGVKTCSIRTGLVLGSDGGALEKMLPPFKLGLGGRLGNGKQWMSWIHIDDLTSIFCHVIEKENIHTVYNAVAPNPVKNTSFTKALGKAIDRPTIFPVPALVLKTLLGEMSDLLLKGQKVTPLNLLFDGFEFKFEYIHGALEDLSSKVFTRTQWVPRDLESVFSFFSNERNLEKITPESLQFKILKKSTPKISEGTIIDYKLKIHMIPFKWKTLISKYKENDYFVDEQKSGPYEKWVHTHKFKSYQNGTLIIDSVKYKEPLGLLGDLFGGFWVKRNLNQIFDYRKKTISEQFL